LGVLQTRTDLTVEVARVDDRRSGGCVQDDRGVHQQGLLGVSDAGQVADRGRLGVQHPQSGYLPLCQSQGQPVGIDEVFGTPPRLRVERAGQVMGCVGFEGREV